MNIFEVQYIKCFPLTFINIQYTQYPSQAYTILIPIVLSYSFMCGMIYRLIVPYIQTNRLLRLCI